MKKEWFATRELVGIAGLPGTPQGINKQAKRKGWLSRQRQGIQGRALEYHISSLPMAASAALVLREAPAQYASIHQDPLMIWNETYHRLTAEEREWTLAFIMREGVDGLLRRLGYQGE